MRTRVPFGGLAILLLFCLGLTVAPPATLRAQDYPAVQLPPADRTLPGQKFSLIQGVSELADGRVLVSDGLEQSLYVVDFRSGEVRSVGSIGDGPGEFRDPGFLYPVGADSTVLTDQSTHRAFLVVGDQHPKSLSAATLLIARLSTEPPLGIDRSGRVLGVEGFGYSGGRLAMSRVEADSLRFLLTDGSVFTWEPGSYETIAEAGGQGRLGGWGRTQFGARRYYTSPLAAEAQAWLFWDGWIALAHPEPYRVDWRKPDGEWVRGEPLPFEPVPVTGRARCFALTGDRDPAACSEPNVTRRMDGLPWANQLPPFVMERLWQNRATPGGIALQPAPDGSLLIQRTLMADAPGRRYDVVDRTGSLRGTIVMPENRTIVGSGPESLYVVTKDDVDLLTLSRHPWPDFPGAGRTPPPSVGLRSGRSFPGPGIHDLDPHVLEIANVARRKLHAAGRRNGCNLAIGRSYWMSGGAACGGNVAVNASGIAVEREHPILEGVAQHRLDPEEERLAAPTQREDGGTVAQLCFAHGGQEQVLHGMTGDPACDRVVGRLAHQFGDDVCVKQSGHGSRPHPKDGGSRAESRSGNSRSTPFSGPKCDRMMLVRSRDRSSRPTALRRICLTSSSIEWPFPAARTRRRVRMSSSRFRIVMLAMSGVSLRGRRITSCQHCKQGGTDPHATAPMMPGSDSHA